jgi:hypothetical protein
MAVVGIRFEHRLMALSAFGSVIFSKPEIYVLEE